MEQIDWFFHSCEEIIIKKAPSPVIVFDESISCIGRVKNNSPILNLIVGLK